MKIVGSHLRAQFIPQFEVFDPDGAQVALASGIDVNADEGAAIANGVIIGQTGAHIIIITGESNTIGQFLVSFGRGSTVRDVYQGVPPSNEQIVGIFEQVGSRHVWQLPLNPNDVISVAVSPNDPLLDPVIELVTADGDVVYADDDGGIDNAALLQLAEITVPATYLLRIYDETGTNKGSYTVLWNYVTLAPTPTPIPSLTNLLVIDDDVIEGQYQFYAFQGQAGQRVRIEAIADGETALDPVIAVLNPSGDIILEADDSPNSLNPSTFLTLPEDGTYQVRINGYLSGGDFILTVAQVYD
ncbi:MAG: pre-peptidase C-terminal domain-containing protein [Chloroflexota bacterium]